MEPNASQVDLPASDDSTEVVAAPPPAAPASKAPSEPKSILKNRTPQINKQNVLKATQSAQRKATRAVNPNTYIDKDNGLYFGRTPKSWLQITVFYIIYYFLLYCVYVVSIGIGTNSLTYHNYKTVDGDIVYKPKVRTRTDQPGLAVYPQNNLFEGRHSDSILNYDSSDENSINEITNVLLHRVIRPNLQTCNKEGPVYKYSERPLHTHKTRFSLIRRQYRGTRNRPLILLKLNRIIDWEPKAITGVVNNTDLYNKIEEFHTGNVYFTCTGYESISEKGKIENDKNFKRVEFLNPQTPVDGSKWNDKSWANGCDKAGDNVGCIPVSWFEKYNGNDPFAVMREQIAKDGSSDADNEEKDPCDAEDDPLLNDKCELEKAERLDKGYKENLMSKGVIPKIVHKSCWPFMIGIVHAVDITKPVKVQCRAWLRNTNIPKDIAAENPNNNAEITFGFRDLHNCDAEKEECDNGGWFEES